MIERQSAAKFLKDLFLEKGSTTIPRKGSKVKEFSLEKPDTKLQLLFSSKRVIRDSNNCIYGIVHLHKPDLIYIGSAKSMIKRAQKHRYLLKHNKHFSKWLQNVCNKYGLYDLYYFIIEQDVDMISREEFWINYFDSVKNGYNATYDTRRNFFSEETLEKIKQANNSRKVKVSMYDLEGFYIKTFDSVTSAAKEINVCTTNISACCTEKVRYLQNYTFRYGENTDQIKIRKSLRSEYGKKASKSICKRVKCTYNNIVTFYNSISDFERNNNIPRGSIGSYIKKKRHYRGMFVEYCEDIV